MSQRARFFDSVSGDRVYTSDAWAQVIAGLIKDGVVPGFGNSLAVSESSPAAMSVDVATGAAYILGYFLEVYSASETLAIAAADPTNPRIDRIVVRRDLASRTAELAVLTGTPAASPSAPALTQNVAGTYEISIAQVRVEALATSILNAKITDERSYGYSYPLTRALDASTGHAHTGAAGDGPAIAYSAISGKPSTFAPSTHTHADGSTGGTVAYSVITGKPSTFAPSDHAHTTSGDGGTVAYASLTGKPSSFTPAAHALGTASGYHTGSLPWSDLSGVPSTFTPASHTLSSHTGTLPYSSLSSVPSTFAPSAHASSHADGGSDEITPDAIGAWEQASAGGGAAGKKIFVGTTTPSSGVSEGDIWVKG
jgi:hypothetical protein